MKQHFQDWGALYQIICSLIFGVITVVLWIQDRKKSKLIHELQKQSTLLFETLNLLKNQDQPCLAIKDRKPTIGWPIITIENVGSDLLNLNFNENISENKEIKIFAKGHPLKLSRNNNFEIKIEQIRLGSLKTDKLKFEFQDNFGRNYEQNLLLSSIIENITFEPVIRK